VAGFSAVGEEVPSAKLLLVGDGPYGEQLAARTRGPLDGRVIFTGEVTGERLATMYASSDVFVYPSETETFGNAIVEAQAAGIPVIVASRGAAPENVVDGVTGLVVDAQKPDEIGSAIRLLLRQPELRRRMGMEAARFARRYDIGRAARGTFDVYAEVLRNLGAGAETARAA
jgi:glycosyltransferase involved in cell wall biosynthesis